MNNLIETYDNAVKDYISNLKHIGASEKTIDNYTKRLNYFRNFLFERENSLNSVEISTVKEWRDSLLEKGLSAKTVKQYLVELNGFFNYATDENCVGKPYFEHNPVSKKIYPRTKAEDNKPYDKILSNEDISKLWENKYKSRSKNWYRNYAIITLLLDGKIRNAELLDIKLSDVDFEYKEVVIPKGKGNKYRIVTLSDISLTAIKLYLLSGYRPKDLSDDDYLFGTMSEHKYGAGRSTSQQWHRGTSQWLSKLVEKHIFTVTGKSGFRTHSLRHNGARLELNAGTSLERLQSELGHSSVSTTEIYAGRLNSVRHARETQAVIDLRNEWAVRNAEEIKRKIS